MDPETFSSAFQIAQYRKFGVKFCAIFLFSLSENSSFSRIKRKAKSEKRKAKSEKRKAKSIKHKA